jgi:integral membrane protein
MQKKHVSFFLTIAFWEGISLLILLGVAVPVKYLLSEPILVKYVGWAHGVLFVLYMLLLLNVWIKESWKFDFVIWAGLASLIPFGTFYLEKQVRKKHTQVD